MEIYTVCVTETIFICHSSSNSVHGDNFDLIFFPIDSLLQVTLEEPAISSLKTVTLLLNNLEDLCFLCNRVANKGEGRYLLNNYINFWFLLG